VTDLEPEAERGLVTCTVLSVERLQGGRILALASVALDFDGILIEVHGLRVVRATKDGREAAGVEMPHYRAADGSMRPTVRLPEELHQPIATAILERSREMGVTRAAVELRTK
jgi:DNA-binding cell septation regulator SpoVG